MTHERATPSSPSLEERLGQLVVERRGELLRFLERSLGRRGGAEEVLQDSLARGLGALDGLRDERLLLPWFYRVLRSEVVDAHRRARARERAVERFAAESLGFVEPPAVPERACACVARVATGLKPEYEEALQRVEVEGATVKDFAAERGISPNAAAVRVFRARESLRKKLFECCGACAEEGCGDCSC